MTGSLGQLLPVSLVEEDGLILTTDGAYVRLIECQRVPNAISADGRGLVAIERAYSNLARSIPDHQSLAIYAQTDPVPLEEALAEDRERTGQAVAADLTAGHDDLAVVRERLLAATHQTVLMAAGAEQPAVAARWWVAVRHFPRGGSPRDQLRDAKARAMGQTLWTSHYEAALESARLAEHTEAALQAAGIDTSLLDGCQTLAVLWERLHPNAVELPDFDELAGACAPWASATTRDDARQARHHVVRAVCAGGGVDASDPRFLRHEDGTLEEVLHLGTPPQATDPSWLTYLLSSPLPTTIAVHISVGAREREQTRQRRRWKRLSAAVRYKERRERIVGSDELDALSEAEQVDQELAGSVGATVYRVGVYVSVRDPHGNVERFQRVVGQLAREFHGLTNSRVIRGRTLCLPGFTSTLPLGCDTLKATRSYAQRNIAHCVTLTSNKCGSPDGLYFGCADPGGTLERVNAFDAVFPRRVTLIIGPSGGGKTVANNLLWIRFLSQGGRGWILDRSSTPDAKGDTAGTGHYDTLLSLIPGSRRVQVGHNAGDVICPWDVEDAASVPSHKIEFLLALHALLIGHAHDTEGLVRTLDADEEALIRWAIEQVYRQCADTAERPREQLLLDALQDRRAGEKDRAIREKVASLLLRLEPFGEAGSLSHIADRETTVHDAPLTLFDTTGMADRLRPALMLAIVDHVEREVRRLRRARVAGELDEGAWSGRAMLSIEEGWKLTSSPAAGAWLNEYARRSRHYALWLTFVSQHFKDLDSEQGRALLGNAVLTIALQNDRDDLEFAKPILGLTDVDIEQIVGLPKMPGAFSTAYMISARGRGAVRLEPGPLEYWIASSDPEHDQPLRHRALKATNNDPWAALALLARGEVR